MVDIDFPAMCFAARRYARGWPMADSSNPERWAGSSDREVVHEASAQGRSSESSTTAAFVVTRDKLIVRDETLWRLITPLRQLVGDDLIVSILESSPPRRQEPIPPTRDIDEDWGHVSYPALLVVRDIAVRAQEADNLSAIRNWFRRRNPRLGNQSPLSVLTTDPPAVSRAARAFLSEERDEWSDDYERQWQSERQRLLSRARDLFGDPLAEVILTHEPEHLMSLHAAAVGLSDEEIEPLREAVSIATDLTEKEATSTIQAWFVGLNPMLGDQEPALVVRDNPRAVRDAARAFLASG